MSDDFYDLLQEYVKIKWRMQRARIYLDVLGSICAMLVAWSSCSLLGLYALEKCGDWPVELGVKMAFWIYLGMALWGFGCWQYCCIIDRDVKT